MSNFYGSSLYINTAAITNSKGVVDWETNPLSNK